MEISGLEQPYHNSMKMYQGHQKVVELCARCLQLWSMMVVKQFHFTSNC